MPFGIRVTTPVTKKGLGLLTAPRDCLPARYSAAKKGWGITLGCVTTSVPSPVRAATVGANRTHGQVDLQAVRIALARWYGPSQAGLSTAESKIPQDGVLRALQNPTSKP